MRRMLDPETLWVMGSALVVAVFFLLPAVQHQLLGYVFMRLLEIGDTLFHEMGHTVFIWLFGRPAVPSIFTLFGTDKAGGMSVPLYPHTWTLQVIVWLVLGSVCFLLRRRRPALFWPVVAVSVILVGLAFTPYTQLIISYMGHGGAIFSGGVLLYRAWSDIIVRTELERWFNALFGFFIVLNNAWFAYQLRYSLVFREYYAETELTMDFTHMTDLMPHWRVEGIAAFTLVYAVLTLLGSFLLATYFYEDEHYKDY